MTTEGWVVLGCVWLLLILLTCALFAGADDRQPEAPVMPEPLIRCPSCTDQVPRSALAEHHAREHRPTPPDRPRRTVRLGGRGKGRR